MISSHLSHDYFGSCYFIFLPISDNQSEVIEIPSPPPATPASTSPSPGERIKVSFVDTLRESFTTFRQCPYPCTPKGKKTCINPSQLVCQFQKASTLFSKTDCIWEERVWQVWLNSDTSIFIDWAHLCHSRNNDFDDFTWIWNEAIKFPIVWYIIPRDNLIRVRATFTIIYKR